MSKKPIPQAGSWRFDLSPVPASRIRVGRYGNYYQKNYESFRRQAAKTIPQMLKGFAPLNQALELWLVFYAPKPRTTKKLWPKGDWDNFAKAITDSMNKLVYADDDQIIDAHAAKRFVEPNDTPHILAVLRTVSPHEPPFGILNKHFTERFRNPAA
jgi:Holliday junction resolvase RusA-like endonuclease